MWPQALGIRRPWGVGELGPVQGMVEGGVWKEALQGPGAEAC